MKKSSATNDLLEQVGKNFVKDLTGAVIQRIRDPIAITINDNTGEEVLPHGLIVKIEPLRQNRKAIAWLFHILLDEVVEIVQYKSLREFSDYWTVLSKPSS